MEYIEYDQSIEYLSPFSKKVIDFIDSNTKIDFYYNYDTRKVNSLYKKIISIYSDIDKDKNDSIIINKLYTSNKLDINSRLKNRFISNKINKSIKENTKTLELYVIKYKDYKIILHSYKKITKAEILKIIKRILLVVVLNNNKTPINIHIFFDNNKKILKYSHYITNNPNSIIGIDEINSGLTTMYDIPEITIFRKEELGKVAIHESIHASGLDIKISSDINTIISRFFNINPNNNFNIFEAYTEVLTIITNCMICSYEITTKNNTTIVDRYALHRLLHYELKFNLIQTAKILNYYKFTDIKEFLIRYDGLNKFKQNTSVFSYFFIKTALLFNLDGFLKFLKKYSLDKKPFKMKSSKEVSKAFITLIIESCYNIVFINILDKYMFFMSHNKSPKFIINTMRMSCIECL